MRATLATWRSIAARAALGLLIAAPLAVLVAAGFTWQGRDASHPPEALALARDYGRYVDAAWFSVPGPTFVAVLIAVLVCSGGPAARPRAELAWLLALPPARRQWIAAHFAAGVAAVGAVIVTCSLILLVGGWLQREFYPPLVLLVRTAAVLFATLPWVAGVVALATIVRRPAVTIALGIALLMLMPGGGFGLQLPAVPPTALPSPWHPWSVADPRMWTGGVPWRTVLTIVAATGVALGVAVARFERVAV